MILFIYLFIFLSVGTIAKDNKLKNCIGKDGSGLILTLMINSNECNIIRVLVSILRINGQGCPLTYIIEPNFSSIHQKIYLSLTRVQDTLPVAMLVFVYMSHDWSKEPKELHMVVTDWCNGFIATVSWLPFDQVAL